MSGYDVRNPEAEAALRKIADDIALELPPGFGFTLLLHTFGESGDLFYISNANREDMVRVMKEFIARETM